LSSRPEALSSRPEGSSPDPLTWAFRPGARTWSAPPAGPSAYDFHRSLPGYQPTRLVELPSLAAALGVGALLVKDESDRFGLPAFKVLGASWAVNQALSARAGGSEPAGTLEELRQRVPNSGLTLVTATDGNHGRAVARMARLVGAAARIYVPQVIAPASVTAIAGEGAEVVETDLVYDEAVALAAASVGDRPNDVLIQDTAWPGYTQVPHWIVDGYATLFREVDDQLAAASTGPADLVAVPTGVGSLLQAALDHYRAADRATRPAVLSVEPLLAACVARSLAAGKLVSVDTSVATIMAGLNCGSVSSIAWPAIRDGLDAGVAVTDDQARSAMAELAELGVWAGACGAAALAGVRAALTEDRSLTDQRRSDLGLTAESVVVLLSTEGRPAEPAAPA
jgi:diaminopropionate ammonia-lyase